MKDIPHILENDQGFLVYIPCHDDFEMARQQAISLRSQFLSLSKIYMSQIKKLSIIISVNGVELSSQQQGWLASACDELMYMPVNIGADSNIALGFFKALQSHPEFFWLLSANDRVADSALEKVLQIFYSNPNCDLIIADNQTDSREFQVSNVLFNPLAGIHFGLISAVIYRSKNTIANFPSALKLNWTGWGQLAVIQTSCFTNGQLNIVSAPGSSLYSRPEDGDIHRNEMFEHNARYYSHSFFGMPILISALYANDDTLRRKYVRSWVFSNWYRVHSFSSHKSNVSQTRIIDEAYWRQIIAQDIVRGNGLISWILYSLGKRISWEKFRHLNFAQAIKEHL